MKRVRTEGDACGSEWAATQREHHRQLPTKGKPVDKACRATPAEPTPALLDPILKIEELKSSADL